jgi:KDO2-lipid IV(A) lauroyltransferase
MSGGASPAAGRGRHLLEELVFVAAQGLLAAAPQRLALAIGRGLGRLAYRSLGSRRRVALENLNRVFGSDLTPAQTARLARRSFESLGMLLADFAALPGRRRQQVGRWVKIDGVEHFERALERGRGVMLITAHSGSWELMPYTLALHGRPLAFVARPADNPRLEGRLRRIREAPGNRVIAKQHAARDLLRSLHAGRVVGILIDQAVAPDRGVLTPFLGLPAYTTDAPAQMLLRTGAAAVPVFLVRQPDPTRHRMVFHPEVEPCRTGDRAHDVEQTTRRIVKVVEAHVRQYPDQWLWCHRRWRS